VTEKVTTYVNHVITFEKTTYPDGNEVFDITDEDELVGPEEYPDYKTARLQALRHTNTSDGLSELLNDRMSRSTKDQLDTLNKLHEYLIESEHQGYEGWEEYEVAVIKALRADIVTWLTT
jgi:hypothetical protein